MLLRQTDTTIPHGVTKLTEEEGLHSEMQMDFSLISLRTDETHEVISQTKESALLLLEGSLVLNWGTRTETVERDSCFSTGPYAVHVAKQVAIRITARRNSECILVQARNETNFASSFYTPEQCKDVPFGHDVLENTSIRTVREIFSHTNAPFSQLVLGEVISRAGRWSSYPPHYHEQPEIYFFRFSKPQGFGAAYVGDTVFKSEHNSALLIPGDLTHPQACAPGYDMYYCWMIRNLGDNYWKERITADEHKWIDLLT